MRLRDSLSFMLLFFQNHLQVGLLHRCPAVCVSRNSQCLDFCLTLTKQVAGPTGAGPPSLPISDMGEGAPGVEGKRVASEEVCYGNSEGHCLW